MPSLLETTADLLSELFDYNRENFQYDRRQRLIFEYQLANLRIDQVKLWREDIRDIVELTPQKMEVYLLVAALELGFCLMALCKGRVPVGAPPWLIACHTLAVCAAIVYLFLAIWFGMHAFVASQAYKVRILTQLVRLPVPSWKSIEAARTYSSAFEKQSVSQVVRVPFAMGRQEDLRPKPRVDQAAGAIGTGRGIIAPQSAGGASLMSTAASLPHGGRASGMPAAPSMPTAGRPLALSALSRGEPTPVSVPVASTADPWGLERRGDDMPELAPDVNTHTEKQKHIWLVREAAKYFQTYDAFCRISMSIGTSSLATFFCYFCLSYVMTENATPVAAWAGMIIFSGCALVIMRQDLHLQGREYSSLAFLNFVGPAMSGIVTFFASKHGGDPGRMEWLMPIALFAQGAWLFYFTFLLRVREVRTSAMLPMAFRAILFLDPFAWAKHIGTGSKSLGRTLHRVNDNSMSRRGPMMGGATAADPKQDALPTNACLDTGAPMRPEDLCDQGAPQGRREGHSFRPTTFAGSTGASFRPTSFAGQVVDNVGEGEPSQYTARVHTGSDIQGQKPGLMPWRVFLFNTVILGLCWWFAAGLAACNAYKGTAVFERADLLQEDVADGARGRAVPLRGSLVSTGWSSLGVLPRPHGLACDASGTLFATAGLLPGGHRGIWYGNLSTTSDEAFRGLRARGGARSGKASIEFTPGPKCSALRTTGADGSDGAVLIQDVSLHDCDSKSGCRALVLPQRGNRLLSCPIGQEEYDASGDNGFDVTREWLEDRGGVDPEAIAAADDLLQPEEFSSVEMLPCGSGSCVAMGTTAKRVVQMSKAGGEQKGPLVPWRLLQEGKAAPVAGTLASLPGGRRLVVLHRGESLVRVVDVEQGGTLAGVWRLQASVPDSENYGTGEQDSRSPDWIAICAGGDSLFALEAGDGGEPNVWQFPIPAAERDQVSAAVRGDVAAAAGILDF